jgi:uncharacterized protein
MIDEAVREHILARLRTAEAEEGVRILYAAESGSRAWGFASPASDYDVRFVYVRPLAWYLRLTEGRDVIERPLDDRLVDFVGWDARKALQLLLKSNPALYEWLSSPLVYIDDDAFRPAATSLFERHARAKTLAYHYASVVSGHWSRNIAGREAVRLKRYFYVIRPLLALQWVIAHGTPPPMSLAGLLAGSTVPGEVRRAIEHLVELKRATPELGDGPRINLLDQWIEAQMVLLDPARHQLMEHDQKATKTDADSLFLQLLGVQAGPRPTTPS